MRVLMGCLVAVAAFITAACEPDTEENVRHALDEANISAVEVDVDEDRDVVHLQGTVETLADRTRAEEIATAVVGTSGRVVNELSVEALSESTTEP